VPRRTKSDPIRSLVAELEAFRKAIAAAETESLATTVAREKSRLTKLLYKLREDIDRLEGKLLNAREDRARNDRAHPARRR
jgi:hypothetical protein